MNTSMNINFFPIFHCKMIFFILNNNTTPFFQKHVSNECENSGSFDCFTILGSAANSYELNIKEAL